MDTVWTELIKALPWGFVIIALRYMDIKEKSIERRERDENAKQKDIADHETQVIIGKTYADAINNLAAVFDDLKTTILDQYKNMGITKDLADAARREITRQRKSE